MEPYMLSGVVGILREIPKIFKKNEKLMVSLILFYHSLVSLFYLSAVFSTKPFLSDCIFRKTLIAVTGPKTPVFSSLLIGVKDNIQYFAAKEWLYDIIITIFTIYFLAATIIASALTHSGKNLSLKQLLLSTIKSLKIPFLVLFCITLFSFGYDLFFFTRMFLIFLVILQPIVAKASAIVLGILATILESYFLSSCIMQALVISALEETRGFQALGKAALIVKGMQLQGFLLNLLFEISGFIIFLCMRLMTIEQSSGIAIVFGLVLVNFSCLVKIFWWMANTVFYYQCKKLHGEKVEFQGSIAYSIIPTSLLDESIP